MSESVADFITQGTEDLVKSFLGLLGIFELELSNSDHQRFHLVNDDIHSNLVFTRRFNNSLLGLIEEDSNTSHHTNSLVNRALVIITGEGILLKEIFSDDLGDFESQFLIFRKGVSTDQLDDFVKFFFLLLGKRVNFIQDYSVIT